MIIGSIILLNAGTPITATTANKSNTTTKVIIDLGIMLFTETLAISALVAPGIFLLFSLILLNKITILYIE